MDCLVFLMAFGSCRRSHRLVPLPAIIPEFNRFLSISLTDLSAQRRLEDFCTIRVIVKPVGLQEREPMFPPRENDAPVILQICLRLSFCVFLGGIKEPTVQLLRFDAFDLGDFFKGLTADHLILVRHYGKTPLTDLMVNFLLFLHFNL